MTHKVSLSGVLFCAISCAILTTDGIAQTTLLAVGSASGRMGSSVTLAVSYTPGATPVDALQFDLGYSSSLSYVSVSAGQAAAGKMVMGSATPSGARVLVFGVNQTPLGSGVVANVQLSVSSGTGAIPVTIGGIVCSDPWAAAVPCSGRNGSVVVLTSSDTTPPVISAVGTAKTGGAEAIITWVTNEPADSEVDLLDAAGASLFTSIDPTLSVAHSQTVSGLKQNTAYTYWVKSRDAEGNLAKAGLYSFTTTSGLSILQTYVLPRLLARNPQDPAAEADYTGIALVNLDSSPADLVFTAVDTGGNPIAGQGISNPVTRTLDPGRQLPIIDTQLFGDGIAESPSAGWIRIESTTRMLRGFFMVFDSRLTVLDGASVSTDATTSVLFPAIEPARTTKLGVVNANSAATAVTLDLVRTDGRVRSSVPRTISANGAIVTELSSALFSGVAPLATDYVRISAGSGIQAFELARGGAGDNEMLNALDGSAGASKLYSPQYVMGGIWQSTLSLVNLDPSPGSVTVRLIGDDAVQIGASMTFSISGQGKINIDNPASFQIFDLAKVTQGYLEIEGNGIRLAGTIVFGDRQGRTLACSLPLVSRLQSSLLVGHVASNDQYYTGIAILNPGSEDAFAKMELHAADGSLVASATEAIPARQRRSRVLTQYFPSVAGQDRTSGYVRITVDKPVAAFSLFGTTNQSVLSAIPLQDLP